MVFFFVVWSTFPAFAIGPNMPVPAYAAGPNAPNAVTATSSPALTTLGYAPTAPATVSYRQSGTTTVSYTAPGGVTTTTTMPASMPMGMAVAPPFSPLFFLVTGVMGIGGCSLLGISIAGLVLIILVWRALANAARLAEAGALPDYGTRPETPPGSADRE